MISSIVCEGLADAAEHARLAHAAGAAALDVMPPHHWLRFGFTPNHALQYFRRSTRRAGPRPGLSRLSCVDARVLFIGAACGAGALPYVQAFKVGQRDMNKYARDIEAIREADPRRPYRPAMTSTCWPRWCRV